MPKQAECAAIIISDSCGFTFWAEDFSQIHNFATCDENGLIDIYRVEYGDTPVYDGKREISFDDLYQQAEGDWREEYRAEIPGTVKYSRKHETAKVEQDAPEAAENGQRDTPGAASLIVIVADEMQATAQAQEATAGEPEAEERLTIKSQPSK